MDFPTHVADESARFEAVLRDAVPTTAVPTCPDWTAADLLWHLTEVQLFWGAIVRDRLDDPQAAERAKPGRPSDPDELANLFSTASATLVEVLSTTPAATPMWMWNADGRHAGYIARRQAHEALIHRVDAEMTVGRPSPLDPELATDGIDEVLSIMYGPADWGTVLPSGPTGQILTTDTETSWTFRVAQFRGTDPDSGKTYFEPVVELLDGRSAPSSIDFTVRGTAGQLDTALWNRAPLADLDVRGDNAAFTALADVIGQGID
ncbi:maleylpyruvate isomerase family mycothiol-dependent enzyme [Euzebya tangerina]|uniref:maleylpyruvate isomerase family mycothiol-dependent enzyme n=1 Tax=Euzebya tangerina TaxID=591198 RepID=UPI000E31FA68|nr:maleylpyruvate isomerase family mycothiol-dependent enzyme [Euzebya tangerina]